MTPKEIRYELQEYHLPLAGRDWTVMHAGFIFTEQDEKNFFDGWTRRLPYGVALWPSAIALASECASRADLLPGKTVLELGAGIGLPGLVAAGLGARAIVTELDEASLTICCLNAEINRVDAIEFRIVDWRDWQDTTQYDYIIGADILYTEAMHPDLLHIFETNLAPNGHILIADPLRPQSRAILEAMQERGWAVAGVPWEMTEAGVTRTSVVFDANRLP
jgi:predicted nicotinamide N-methyase